MHEYIFLSSGLMEKPDAWSNAMRLENRDIKTSFRIDSPPIVGEAELDRQINNLRFRGYDYYITASSSVYGLDNMYWDPSIIEEKISDVHCRGLYLTEIKTLSHEYGRLLNWDILSEYFVDARNNAKNAIWSEWGFGWELIRTDPSYNSVFSEYGDVIIPMWANNDVMNWEWALSDAKQASLNMCYGKLGASIQDWYWWELGKVIEGRPYRRSHMPAFLVYNFIKLNHDEGGTYTQFEYEWDDPEFFEGIILGRNYISPPLKLPVAIMGIASVGVPLSIIAVDRMRRPL